MNEGQLPPTTPSSPLSQQPAIPPTPPPVTPASAPVQPVSPPPQIPTQPRVAPPPPPWLQRPRTPLPAQQTPTPLSFAAQNTSSNLPAAPAASEGQKNWGPLKPIRKVPKPSDAKAAYILAQSEHVVLPEEEAGQRKWIIAASILAFLVIGGGTVAFVFFGRDAKTSSTNTLRVVNTSMANVNTSGVFPTANTNASTNVAAVDTDGDGLNDADETVRGTDLQKPDTDGDGYTDGQEVSGGYNPLGPGKL